MKNKGFYALFFIYILFLLGDIITTLFVKHKEVLEANIIYKYIGFTGIIVLNCAVAWLLWWLYSRPSAPPAVRFTLMMSMLMIIAARAYAIPNAWYFILNPVTYQQATLIATPQAMKETVKQMSVVAYPPFIMGIIGYIFWRIDHDVRRK